MMSFGLGASEAEPSADRDGAFWQQPALGHTVTVRKTFIEVDEDHESDEGDSLPTRLRSSPAQLAAMSRVLLSNEAEVSGVEERWLWSDIDFSDDADVEALGSDTSSPYSPFSSAHDESTERERRVSVDSAASVQSEGRPSAGSALHAADACKPCAWFWKAQGCKWGDECRYCHMCPSDALKNNGRQRWRR